MNDLFMHFDDFDTKGHDGSLWENTHLWENVNILNWNGAPDATCRFGLSEKAQFFVGEDETFLR